MGRQLDLQTFPVCPWLVGSLAFLANPVLCTQAAPSSIALALVPGDSGAEGTLCAQRCGALRQSPLGQEEAWGSAHQKLEF